MPTVYQCLTNFYALNDVTALNITQRKEVGKRIGIAWRSQENMPVAGIIISNEPEGYFNVTFYPKQFSPIIYQTITDYYKELSEIPPEPPPQKKRKRIPVAQKIFSLKK